MAYDYEILEVKKISLKKLVIGKGQSRKTQVSKELNELADSIRAIGQIHPIVVCESTTIPGKFEILTGQRRFLACCELGQKDIWATILDRSVPEEEAKVISLSENIIQTDLADQDIIDVCTYLWKIYDDPKIIAEKTGLPIDKVKDHVKYISLIPKLRDLVDSGMVEQKTALRAQRALEATGEVKPDAAVSLAKDLQGCIGTQQAKVVQEIKSGAAATTEEIRSLIKSVKTGPTLVELRIRLFPEQDMALRNYAKAEGMKREDAAQNLIMESLTSRGLIEEPEE